MSDTKTLQCPRCDDTIEVGTMRLGGSETGTSYQCIPCDWLAVQPPQNPLTPEVFVQLAEQSDRQARNAA